MYIDGYNVLTTVEAALGGGVLLLARDGALRDMASMHGSYRKVAETVPALELLGRTIADLGVTESVWYLDRPVSNSGRLKGIMEQLAAQRGWPWRVELVDDPDAVLMEIARACGAGVSPAAAAGTAAPQGAIVATADSAILDHCDAWLNLARETVERHVPGANVVDLSSIGEPDTPPLSDDELTAAAADAFRELDRCEAQDA